MPTAPTADRRIFDALAADLQNRLRVRIRFKNESRFMRLLGVLLLFNRSFMTMYITTIGRTVYYPDRKHVEGDYPDWQTLAHEGVHAADYARSPVGFVFRYLFPQCLAVLSMLSLLAIPFGLEWLGCLLFLLALAPWPSAGRVALERRGYMMSMVCVGLFAESINVPLSIVMRPAYLKVIEEQFTTGAYYFMSWNKAAVERDILADARHAVALVEGTDSDPDYSHTIRLIRAAQRAQ